MNIESFKINNIKYVECDKVLELAPIYSKPSKNTRSLIRAKNIPDNMYVYARKDEDGVWIVTDGKSIKFDKVLLRYAFLKKIPEMNRKEGEVIENDDGIKEAPPIIVLKDDEKFKDNDGNLFEIETRGARKSNGVYFKVRDVASVFEIESLHDTLLKKNTKI